MVRIYVNNVESSLSTPVKKLYRFLKITLEPGELKTVSFTIPVSELGFYTDGPEKIVEEGGFVVSVGGLTASFGEEVSRSKPFRCLPPVKDSWEVLLTVCDAVSLSSVFLKYRVLTSFKTRVALVG